MADLYWNPAADTTWNSATAWATSDGGTPNQTPPSTNDNAHFSNTNAHKCTLSADVTVTNLDFVYGTGFTGQLATSGGARVLNVSGNIAFSSGMNLTALSNLTLNTTGTSGTQTIASNTNTLTVALLNLNGAATVQLSDNIKLQSIAADGGALTNTSATFDPNGKLVTLSPRQLSQLLVTGTFSFYDLTLNLAGAIEADVALANDITVTHNLAVTGNSKACRIALISSVIGTYRTITCNGTVTASGGDFQYIHAAGSASWDLSSAANYSGDCGGNSGITFTAADTETWKTAAGGDYLTSSNWQGGTVSRVPIPQDTVSFNKAFGTGSTVSFGTSYKLRLPTISWTGATYTTSLTFDLSRAYNGSNSYFLGSFTGLSGLTITWPSTIPNFIGRGADTLTIAGSTFSKTLVVNKPGGSGSLTLQDNVTTSGITLTNGTLTLADGITVTNTSNVIQTASGTTFNMGSGGTLINTMTSGTCFNINAGTTLGATTTTIKLTGAQSNDLTFTGGGRTFGNIWVNTANAYKLIFSDGNTFSDFKVDAGRSVVFPNSTTTTVTTLTTPNTGTRVKLRNTSSTTHTTLAKSGGGRISCDYIDIDYVTGSPTSTWYVGTNSLDGGHNTNIYFTAPPIIPASFFAKMVR